MCYYKVRIGLYLLSEHLVTSILGGRSLTARVMCHAGQLLIGCLGLVLILWGEAFLYVLDR